MTHSLFTHRKPCSCGPSAALRRSGFTLFELILVLSVLGIMAALSWPRMLTQLRQQTLEGNVEQVRQVLDRARVRAVEEGRALQMRFEPRGRRYVILPNDPANPDVTDSGTPSAGTTTRFRDAPVTTTPFRMYTLAEECSFHVDNALLSGESIVTERLDDAWLTEIVNAGDARDVNWSTPIVFHPDGSATDGTWVVMDNQRRYIKLRVRGLTGAVSKTSLSVMSENLGATGN